MLKRRDVFVIVFVLLALAGIAVAVMGVGNDASGATPKSTTHAERQTRAMEREAKIMEGILDELKKMNATLNDIKRK